MKVVSVNVGKPRPVIWNDRAYSSAIFKEAVEGQVRVGRLNLEGDRQADLSVHGGPNKAVYAYPAEHYDFWRHAYPSLEMPWGMLGENVTTLGLSEDTVGIGDRFQFGSAILMVTQPRLPCQKLAAKFGGPDVGKRMLAGLLTGFYLAVIKEGYVAAGDSIELIQRDRNSLKVSEVVRLHTSDKSNRLLLERAVGTEALPQSWKDAFSKHLRQLDA